MSLTQKAKRYGQLVALRMDRHGFVESHECDSLLFSCLLGCVPGYEFNVDSARDKRGKWHRRPCERPCYPHGSKSSISRDMLLGLAWYAYHQKRLDISEGVIKYALSHFMVMGEGVLSRTIITPSLLATFAWVSYRLGGPSRRWLRWIPPDAGGNLADYQAHLQVLHILLRKDLAGKCSAKDRSTLEAQAKRQPRNPLLLIAANKFKEAAEVLKDEKLWPSDRLPTSADRKAQWLPMRDEGSDWNPSDEGLKTHSGGDFLFCCWLLRRSRPGFVFA